MTLTTTSFLLKSQTPNVEDEIVQLLAQRHRKSINLVYTKYGNALYGIILRIVKSDKVAEEVLQDVMIKIWKNADKYDAQKGRLFTWLSNIARNTAIDYLRTARCIREQKTDSILEHSLLAQQFLTHSESSDFALKRIVSLLDDRHRILIELAYFEGYSQREIEKKINIPLGTIKTRLRLAINQLRLILQKDKQNGLL